MFSFAAFRYRNCLSEEGGPIERIEQSPISVMGESQWQANAYLCGGLVTHRNRLAVYSQADGSGTSPSPMVARYKSVSEALERWAFHNTCASPLRRRYGFDRDPSSNGMAAFPGLSWRSSRRLAMLEAVERFCLLSWWEGLLDGTPLPLDEKGVDGVELSYHEEDVVVAILHKGTHDGFHCYGHGAGFTLREAKIRALVELARNEVVVRRYLRLQAGTRVGYISPTDILEKRCLFFSTEQGYDRFQTARLRAPHYKNRKMELLYDGEIPGPWSRYACVWRVAVLPPSEAFFTAGEDYYFW